MPPVVEKVIERVEVPVEKVIVEPCKRAHLPIALYDPLMAKLSNRMGTWRFDDGWHIVEKFLDSESNEEPQKNCWLGRCDSTRIRVAQEKLLLARIGSQTASQSRSRRLVSKLNLVILAPK
jgi:hypothetical protein